MIDPNLPPLSEHALAALRRCRDQWVPCQEINPGVVRKLTSEGWAEIGSIPTPYATRRGNVEAIRASATGRARIAYEDQS